MDANEFRDKFLAFFVEKGHQIEPSASLVPLDDPSLLWINSGVATLKKYFDGRLVPENPRIVNVQKSIRTNDIENVGYTSRHHTFFEMLGNFSIGDYFKEEAITWAWELLTEKKWLGLDSEKLSVTIHPDDDEAFQYWHKKIGIPIDRIVKLKGNFWDIGEGPSGPNTEIFYDRGPSFGDESDAECYPGGENERYLEIWNLVFSQYNHNPDGSYTPLPKKNIDTGMGFERMLSVLQNVPSTYDTSLFQPIIQETCKRAGVRYKEDKKIDIALQVIADHIRTIVFAIGDGVLPSNEGRGYILRRLLRRASRYGFNLGIKKAFLYEYTSVVAESMKTFYPDPYNKKVFIERVILEEEERFLITLDEGLRMLEEVVSSVKQKGEQQLSGKEVFKLYDTYGFPLELTEEYVLEHSLSVNRKEFEEEMEKQRERSRSSRSDVSSMKIQNGVLEGLPSISQFIGYDQLTSCSSIEFIIVDNQFVDELKEGETGLVLLDRTPFYAESGGQVADVGWFSTNTAKLNVKHVLKGPKGDHIHEVVVEEGSIKKGEEVHSEVNQFLRREIRKNHTATHLLHKALQEALGEHVSQAGSLVTAEYLRFDFSHGKALTSKEINEVEERVNDVIWGNNKVEIREMSFADARELGAMALFGEKYGEMVRVVKVGNYSVELCGGTHVESTSELGLFKITNECGIGSGIRRVEAIIGKHAFVFLNNQAITLQDIASDLKSSPEDVVKRISGLKEKIQELTKQKEMLQLESDQHLAKELIHQIKEIQGVPVLTSHVKSRKMESLRKMMDELRQKVDGVIVLGTIMDDKVNLVVSVSKKYSTKGLHAGKMVKFLAEICGGGGGGRPDMAQAGGKDPHQLPKALQKVDELVSNMYNVRS